MITQEQKEYIQTLFSEGKSKTEALPFRLSFFLRWFLSMTIFMSPFLLIVIFSKTFSVWVFLRFFFN